MDEWKYQPARDLQLPFSDRFRDIRREGGLIATFAQFTWWKCVRLYLRFFHRLTINGAENLPSQLPFVVVANHSSHLDVLILGASLPASIWQHMYPLAAGDTFFEKLPMATFAALCLNALPIWRKRCDPKDIEQLSARLIEEGCVYLLFPEGTRSRTGEMAAFKRGVGILTAGTAVPVVPAYIKGAFEALPAGSKVARRLPISITYGKPISFADCERNHVGTKQVASALEGAVRELRGKKPSATCQAETITP